MSQENVEIVRGIYAEWERGNMKAGVEVLDPEIAFEAYMPDGRGKDRGPWARAGRGVHA